MFEIEKKMTWYVESITDWRNVEECFDDLLFEHRSRLKKARKDGQQQHYY